MLEKLKNRFIVMAIVYVVCFGFISLQLLNLQVFNGEEYDQLSQRRLLRNSNIQAPRGNILDRNNVPIAVNRMGYSVLVSRSGLKADELNEMIHQLNKIFEKNKEFAVNTLSKYLKFAPVAYGDYLNQSEPAQEKWKKEIVQDVKEMEGIQTPEDAFNYLRNVKFKISSKYTTEEAYKIMAVRYDMFVYGYTAVNPIFLARDVSSETVAEIEERHNEFPGVITEVNPMRRYVDAEPMAHIVGYIGKINEKEYASKKDFGYGVTDLIGKTGIEVSEEQKLKGTNGLRQVEVDTKGRLTSEISGIPVIPGNDVILTIDTKLQKVAMKALENRIAAIRQQADGRSNHGDAFAGAAVAMDVNTGEVLTLASYPSYDPAVFLAGTDDYEAQKKRVQYLTDSKNIPMYNRAIQGRYIPGSIYKPITAIAALEEDIVTASDKIYDSGEFAVPGRIFKCLEFRLGYGAHGSIDLSKALATSCNIYFHDVGVRTGIDYISKWTKLFGLGTPTGIDLPGEDTGILGDKDFKTKSKLGSWYPADTAQTAIGQLYNSFTPIQIVNYVSAIANGGKLLKPYVVKKVVKSDGTLLQETSPQFSQIPVKPETIAAVKEGMVAVTNASDGTAVATFQGFPFKVAGKTGTPETGYEAGKQSSNGLFICYAPADNPKIAVVVVLEKGVWGANAAPVASEILKEYFGLNTPASSEEKALPEIVTIIP